MRLPFLTARWESLLMLTYRCAPAALAPLLPAGVELDTWEGETLVSLVGFLFLGTRVCGLPVPGHRNFEEVNLRFYVRRTTPDGDLRRGVVFVKELVPRPMIALVARGLYHEPYHVAPMVHEHDLDAQRGGSASYAWSLGGRDYCPGGSVSGPASPPAAGSHEEFITEHYWGYTRRSNGRTSEQQVTHHRWHLWTCDTATFIGDGGALYGSEFAEVLAAEPVSSLLAVGSEVALYPGKLLLP